MLSPLLLLDAAEIPPGKLKIPKARELAAFLERRDVPYIRLMRCERSMSAIPYEAVVFQVEVELGQKQVYDIRQFEPVAVVFEPRDQIIPDAVALREDFPITPHQNRRPYERPCSLCLYEEPYPELKLRWTALIFVERIREWLRLTARGELHQEDQQLEPLLSSADGIMILPHDFLDHVDANSPSTMAIEVLNQSKDTPIYRLRFNAKEDRSAKPRIIGTVFVTPPFQHGIIRAQPANLYELHKFCQSSNYDFLRELSERMRKWIAEKGAEDLNEARFVMIAVFQRTRHANAKVEYPDIWVFCSPDSFRQMAVALGVEGEKKVGGFSGVVINVGKTGSEDLSSVKNVRIFPLRPVYSLNSESAAAFNGFSKPVSKRLVAVGMGAIGSQIFNNLMRSGYGQWVLIDKDVFLPHNSTRHALPGNAVGMNKADALVTLARMTIDGAPVASSLPIDVFEPGDKSEDLSKAFASADVIVDFSASVAVARHLSDRVVSKARRISIFLNPTGTDLVVMLEDTARRRPLAWLEMEYYRYVATEETLKGHLEDKAGRKRYARSCGDISSTMYQGLVALHAAIGGQALRNLVEQNSASILVFRAATDDFTVQKIVFEPSRPLLRKASDWRIYVSERALKQVHAMRKEHLPNETGGVLIGSFDLEHRVIHVVHVLGSPEDSVEWPALYVRGVRGLRTELERIGRTTLSNLEYIGEWHSHPQGCAPKQSSTDRLAHAILATHMSGAGLPAIMLIVGDRNRQEFFIR